MDIGKQWSAVQSATLTVLPAKGYINGTVRDKSTKDGIPYARASTNTSETTTANSTGFYSLYVDAGSYMHRDERSQILCEQLCNGKCGAGCYNIAGY